MKRILLSSLDKYVVLPQLVLGNVCLVNVLTLNYHLIAVGKYTEIKEGQTIDPNKYVLLITDRYVCIVDAKKYETTDHMATKQWHSLGYMGKIKNAFYSITFDIKGL